MNNYYLSIETCPHCNTAMGLIYNSAEWISECMNSLCKPEPKKSTECECGAHKVGSNAHSNWCPKQAGDANK